MNFFKSWSIFLLTLAMLFPLSIWPLHPNKLRVDVRLSSRLFLDTRAHSGHHEQGTHFDFRHFALHFALPNTWILPPFLAHANLLCNPISDSVSPIFPFSLLFSNKSEGSCVFKTPDKLFLPFSRQCLLKITLKEMESHFPAVVASERAKLLTASSHLDQVKQAALPSVQLSPRIIPRLLICRAPPTSLHR